MTQLLKHYLVDRDNPGVFATTPEQYSRPLFGTMGPDIEGLEDVYTLVDENGIQYFLSNCPDETVIEEVTGLEVLTQVEWDAEIATYDARQETKRWEFVRKYRDQLLAQTDWIVIKATEQGTNLATDFKDWRQSLRDLPESQTFPLELPAAPAGVSVEQATYDNYIAELRSVPMINDPLPAPEAFDD
jgi:hypothetical protein